MPFTLAMRYDVIHKLKNDDYILGLTFHCRDVLDEAVELRRFLQRLFDETGVEVWVQTSYPYALEWENRGQAVDKLFVSYIDKLVVSAREERLELPTVGTVNGCVIDIEKLKRSL